MAAAAGATNKATVKAVLSGDTIIVMGAAQGGPPPEKQITLSGILAPRLGRRDGSTKDEPYAWASREFLRKKLIGQAVQFRIDQAVASIGREFGTVYLGDENVVASVVAHGWAKVKPSKDARSEEMDELVRLEGAAQEAGLGIFNRDDGAAAASIRNLLLPEHYKAADVQAAAGTEPQEAVIEQVQSGGQVRALLLPRFIAITLHLSGIQCPSIRREGEQETAEPYAREAKFFTEARLLNRDVRIRIEGIDKYQNFFGTIIHPAGNISESLLTNGLAKVVEWSIKNNPDKDKLYRAERAAKAQHLRVWRDYVAPPVQTVEGGREFVGKLVEVLSGDVVVVKDTSTEDPTALRKFALSSIRAPRAGNARAGSKDEPCAAEAKEFVRSRFIGKRVRVTVDYTRPIPIGGDKTEDRQFATIEADKTNIALALVAVGLAAVQRHRGDDPRSLAYDELLAAEAEAQKNGKGMHSKKPPATRLVNDISGSGHLTAAKQFLPSLLRVGRVSGVVDYVVNGSRLKIHIPKQSCLIAFALSGVRCPSAPRRDREDEPGEPFGEAAWMFTREHVLQHDVEIEVEAQDKVGTFIGTLWVQGRNLALLLLEQGLARLQPGFRDDRIADADALLAAEQRAKKAQLRLWQGYVEPKPEDLEEKEIAPEALHVTCTHVQDGTVLYLQRTSEAKETLPKLQEHLAKLGATPPVHGFAPKNGEIVCGRFKADGNWYRARILHRQPGSYSVSFVDYGNTDTISADDVRPLGPALSGAEPLAKECQLAFLKPPKEDDYADEAHHALSDLVLDRDFTAVVEWKERTGRLHVTLQLPDATETVNQTLLRAGLARIGRQRRPAERVEKLIAKLQIDQDHARRTRVNIWRFGDCVESDDEEGPRGGAAAGGGGGRR